MITECAFNIHDGDRTNIPIITLVLLSPIIGELLSGSAPLFRVFPSIWLYCTCRSLWGWSPTCTGARYKMGEGMGKYPTPRGGLGYYRRGTRSEEFL